MFSRKGQGAKLQSQKDVRAFYLNETTKNCN
jgi:hypothetical protein